MRTALERYSGNAAAAREPIDARAVKVRVGIDGVIDESGQSQSRFDGRSGRVGPAQSPVDERQIDVVAQSRIFGTSEAAAEKTRVEARAAHQGDDIAIAWIQCDDGAAACAQLLFGDALHVEIECED